MPRSMARATLQHAALVLASMAAGLAVALPLALPAMRRPRLRAALLGGSALLYAVPSLALFALLLPLTGLGATSAIIGSSEGAGLEWPLLPPNRASK